ncbi:MAG: FliG C-terminal domain-containing protein [Spirochaetales bacterium]|nr:FliG C-terminal domain-containing protein [Spirochaetales bacterium]
METKKTTSPGPPVSQEAKEENSSGKGDLFLRAIQEKQGLLKGADPVEHQGDKLDRAAKFLLLLGKEEAGKVLKNLPEDQVEKICSRIAAVKHVDALESQSILEEFGFLKKVRPERSNGGLAMARDILASAFGEEQGRSILEKAVPESRPKPFDFLKDVELPQLLNLVKDESPLVLSVLLSSLPAEKSSQIIKSLDAETRKTVLLRMGHMEKIDRKTLSLMEETLMDRLNRQGRMESIELDGPNKLASILKYMSLGDEKKILDDLADKDEALSEEVKEQLLTIDAVLHLREEDLQKILQEFPEKEIARLLRGKEAEIQTRILQNLSTRRRQYVEEESALMGPIRRSEAEEVTKEFLDYLRRKEEAGEIVIMREEEEYLT